MSGFLNLFLSGSAILVHDHVKKIFLSNGNCLTC